MALSQIVSELKEHLQRGEQLLASHVPGLTEWAEKAEADPLVQAALGLVVPDATRVMLASLLKSVEADVREIEAKATAAAEAAAAAPPEPDPIPAEPVS